MGGGNYPRPGEISLAHRGVLFLDDRIDIHVDVPRVDYHKLTDQRLGERSAGVQARVEAAAASVLTTKASGHKGHEDSLTATGVESAK